MKEWDEGISKWRADRVKSAFKKKHARSLGSSRKSPLFSRRHKMSARHSRSKKQRLHRVSPKMQREWAEGISQWVIRRGVARSNHYFLKKFGIIKGNSSEEWKEGIQVWLDQGLLNKSWKWRASKGKFKPSKNRRRIKRLKSVISGENRFRLKSHIPIKRKQTSTASTESEANSEELEIYVFKNEQQFGPYPLDEIEKFLVNSQFNLDDLAFYNGCEDWIKVSELPGLNFKEKSNSTETFTNESEQSNEEKAESFNEINEKETRVGLGLLKNQIKPQKKSKSFTLGICSLVGAILCLVYGLGYFHGKAVDKTVIVKKHIEDEKVSDHNIANSPDEKFEASRSDEEKMNSMINQGPMIKRYTPIPRLTKKTEQGPVVKLNTPTSHTLELNSSVILEMLWVEPGTFTMGSSTTEAGRSTLRDQETQHQVTLTNGFYLGKYEVTQAQYQTVINGNPEGLNADPSQFKGSNRPVERVSWENVQIFLSRLNFQQSANIPAGWKYVLPTEAQWEYACRAGTTTAYSWGATIAISNANYSTSGLSQTSDVGYYAANPWGFFDMHGNVFEWTADWYGTYPTGNPVVDPTGPASGSFRARRGGSWHNDATDLRSAKRFHIPPSYRYRNIGFRVGFQSSQ
jgi:formylglycine-generating enzyme required for sulfatase activity